MRETDPDDIIDWSAPPDEIWFAFALEEADIPGSAVTHEVSVAFRGAHPDSTFAARPGRADVVVSPVVAEVDSLGSVELRFRVEAPAPVGDDELTLELSDDDSPHVQPIRIRRTRCRIETALIHPPSGGDRGHPPLGDHVRAALLWYGWGRCTRLVGIKRFDAGLSGSEVFVFRPRLAAPRLEPGAHEDEDFAGCSPPELWAESWGAWLLVKAGGVRQVRKEWARHDVFLRDRLTPFMARTEAMLRVRPAPRLTPLVAPDTDRVKKKGGVEEVEEPTGRATLISTFLGGDLVRAEPLEFRLQGGDDPASCRAVIARAFETLAAWYHPGRVGTLGQFRRYFKVRDGGFYLFGPKVRFPNGREEIAYDLTRRQHRELFGAKTTWDVAFQRSDHLDGHLLGTSKRPGLLPLLMETKVRHGLIHGDLNPRNILCDRDYAWLIDFEHAGYGPTLHDFAWLEANLRYFCLSLSPGGESLDEAATRFERHLLDHLHGSEASLEPVRLWAGELGADPDQLYKLAAAIVQVRQLALPYCVEEYADHRDYLAVLYLAVLSLLRGDRPMTAPPANYRALVRLAWVLEEQLSRIHGLDPYDPDRVAPELKNLIDAEWLMAPGAPGRVAYLVRSADGEKALGPVAATRGVQQSEYHHLDVLDHTLSVLAYVEGLLEPDDPLAGFLDPAALDEMVGERLAAQGLRFPPGVNRLAQGPGNHEGPILEQAREALIEALGEAHAGTGRLLLKWCALLHDVGKPGVRSMSADGQIHVFGHAEYGLQLLEGHFATWFDDDQAGRLRDLILRHHDHNNLAKEDHEAVKNLADLGRFAIDPSKVSYKEFQRLWPLVESVISRRSDGKPEGQGTPELRRDFPLLILHGFADSLASRGHHCPLPVGRRAEIYLVFLALWNRRDPLASIRIEWLLCRKRTTKEENPELHLAFFPPGEKIDPRRQKILGQLPEWGWGRVQVEGKCPSLEEFVEEARRRLGEM